MNAQLKSVFANHIDQMSKDVTYITQMDASRLLNLVKASHPALLRIEEKAVSNKSTSDMLREQIEAFGDTIRQMQMASIGSEGGLDAGDLKKVADTQEKQIKMLAKLADTLRADERQQHLENALVEALDTVDQTFREKVLAAFHKKLAEGARKVKFD